MFQAFELIIQNVLLIPSFVSLLDTVNIIHFFMILYELIKFYLNTTFNMYTTCFRTPCIQECI